MRLRLSLAMSLLMVVPLLAAPFELQDQGQQSSAPTQSQKPNEPSKGQVDPNQVGGASEKSAKELPKKSPKKQHPVNPNDPAAVAKTAKKKTATEQAAKKKDKSEQKDAFSPRN
jgi:hypothetical protein